MRKNMPVRKQSEFTQREIAQPIFTGSKY